MDYRDLIDSLAVERTAEEIQAGQELLGIEKTQGFFTEEWDNAKQRYMHARSPNHLRNAGLQNALAYTFQARAAYELTLIFEEMGREAISIYGLKPSGSRGIGLDWKLLSERIWVPKSYMNLPQRDQAVLQDDEKNCLFYLSMAHLWSYLENTQVLEFSSEEKILMLLLPEYRENVRNYSALLLEEAVRYDEEIHSGFIKAFHQMHKDYVEQMGVECVHML